MKNKILNTRPMMDAYDTYVLRGVCMIMIHHVIKYASYCPTEILRWGDLGTAVFFFISGWGLYCSMTKKEQVDWPYLYRNLKKIILPFVIIWCLDEIVYCILHPDYLNVTNILRDGITFSYPPSWMSLWFMKTIIGTYIVAILTFILIKKRIWRLIIVSVLLGAYVLFAWKLLRLPEYWFCSLPCFVAGMWLSAYKENLKGIMSYKYTIAIIATILFVVFIFHNFFPFPSRISVNIAFCCMFVALGSIVNIQSKLLYFIGKQSLLFYLVHIALVDFVTEASFFNQQYMLSLSAIFVVTLALCYGYTKVQDRIEKRS